jgi:hypothetical protein
MSRIRAAATARLAAVEQAVDVLRANLTTARQWLQTWVLPISPQEPLCHHHHHRASMGSTEQRYAEFHSLFKSPIYQ